MGQGIASTDRVAAWAGNPNYPVFRAGPRSAPPTNYPSSTLGSVGGSIRRRGTRRNITRTPASSTYEDEEGYASGDYDDNVFELGKIRVKVNTEVCGHVELSLTSRSCI